jgi:ketosteroid isomerase-like protein
MTKVRFLIVILALLFSMAANAQNRDSLPVMQSVNNFVAAFNNLSWEDFRKSFSDDATIFYPFWDQARRVNGKQEIESAWLTIFPEFGDSNNTRKLQISPKDIHIQHYGKTAIVTFHLGDGVNTFSRRTLVMVKKKQNWKIVHLHASSVSKNKD